MSEETPYARTALDYLGAGWSPLPLPEAEKWPPPDSPHSFTGAEGQMVERKYVKAWISPGANGRPRRVKAGKLSFIASNIALRLPEGVLGLDVDMYSGKTGREAIAEGEKRWGKLPDTWISSSRRDGSGIRLYRIPEKLAWPGELTKHVGHGGVELIRYDHRYAIVFPSIHDKTKEVYRWWFGSAGAATDSSAWQSGDDDEGWEFPGVDDLPWLPPQWVEGLTNGVPRSASGPVTEMSEEGVTAWLNARNGATTASCLAMRKTTTITLQAIRLSGDDGGAHEAARNGAWAVIGDAAAGHTGVLRALKKIRAAFFEAAGDRREERVLRGEWARILFRGVAKVAAEGDPDSEDLCAMLGEESRAEEPEESASSASSADKAEPSSVISLDSRRDRRNPAGVDDGGDSSATGTDGPVAQSRPKRRSGSASFDFARDDIGNAQRLVRELRGEAAYVPGRGRDVWMIWGPNAKRWVEDGDGAVSRKAMNVVRAMEEEAAFIEDAKQKAAFLSYCRTSSNAGKLGAMTRLAADMPGMTLPASAFDASPTLLGCANGVLDLMGGDPAGDESGIEGWVAGPGQAERVPPVRLRPAIPEMRVSLTTGVEYARDARTPEWDKFLARVLPDEEVRHWAQKLVGYSLLGGNPERLFCIGFGPTSTGKTTFMKAIASALGDYGSVYDLSLFRAAQDERPRADILDVVDRRWIYYEEASHEWHLHADQVKKMTGGGQISARLPFAKVPIKKQPSFTPWMFTNAAPTIEGADQALWRRILVIPFDVTIPKSGKGAEDPALQDRLCSSASRPGILAWVVAGWEAYRREGLRDAPAVGEKAGEKFREEISLSETFLAEVCERSREFAESPSSLFTIYGVWCDRNEITRRERMSGVKFGRWLGANGFPRKSVRTEDGPRYQRLGIRVRKEWRRLLPDEES